MLDELSTRLGAALAGRYRLIRILGRGGMATVYLAEDQKHHREVALKVLRPDLTASLGTERFLSEIGFIAKLTHPHILTLHDSGEAGGFLYYVTPFLSGGSLRARLANGPLPSVQVVLRVGEIAAAITYAHRLGILHRDIKPENILFSDDRPVVADFGIARAIVSAGDARLTNTGLPVGTPGYMSPEQAAGLTELGPASDVYALGVVCYEMLVGQTPGGWPSDDAVRAGRFLEAPAAHRTVLDRLPPHVEPALVRALAVRPERRTQTPQRLAEELRADAGLVRSPVQPERSPPGRPFNRDEVQQILGRAAEQEASRPTQSGAMTLGTLQKVAAESGIDPALVRKEADRLDARRPASLLDSSSGGSPVAAVLLGSPLCISRERVIPRELTATHCAYLLEDVRRTFGRTGRLSQLGTTLSWESNHINSLGYRDDWDIRVSFSMLRGQTRIVLHENLSFPARLIFSVLLILVGGFCGMILWRVLLNAAVSPLVAGAAIWLGWGPGSVLVARTLYRYLAKQRDRTLQALADRLTETALQLTDASTAPSDGRR